MLFIQDQDGQYCPAPECLILTEANRISANQLQKGSPITSSSDARLTIGHRLRDKQCEVFSCLFLDSRHHILAFKEMFRGSINKATVHPREVVREALQLNAAACILAHNHPSGGSQPSCQDIELTHKLMEILKIIDVQVLDHLVVGNEIYSFADAGLMVKGGDKDGYVD